MSKNYEWISRTKVELFINQIHKWMGRLFVQTIHSSSTTLQQELSCTTYEYCFCRFRKIIFDSYSKTHKNTQSWIDLFWFRFVLVLSISTTWSLSLLHLYMLRYLSDNGGYSGQNFLFFHSPKKWKSLFLPCFSCHFYRKFFSREHSFRNKFARELFKYQNLYIKGF